jgi:hypothetical protein
MRPEPALGGGVLELDNRWDEQAVVTNQDEVTSAEEAPYLEAV